MTKTNWIGQEIFHKEITGSTNQDIKELAMSGATQGTVVCADMQTAGRGRRGRSWLSNKGDGLLFSLLLRPDIAPDKVSQITLLMALAVAKVLRKTYAFDARIKWPNDILVNGKKTTGILTEMIAEENRIQALLIGIGINVNQEQADFPDALQTIATSVAIEEGQQVDRVQLVAKVLDFLEHYGDHYVKHGFPLIKKLWEESSCTIGSQVRATTLREVVEGEAIAITDSGVLEIRQANGEIKGVYSADIEIL